MWREENATEKDSRRWQGDPITMEQGNSQNCVNS